MPRRGGVPTRDVLADPMYNSKVVTKLVNQVMLDGKKGLAEAIVYGAFDIIKDKTGTEGIEVYKQALENVKPVLETKGRRVGGATYQVPTEVRPDRQQALAIRWIIAAARGRSEKTMEQRLFGELQDAYNNRGNAIRKREDTHRMADANKAFAHFKW